jgi:hypothetical protein
MSKIAQKHWCNAITILLQPQNLAAEEHAMSSDGKFHHRQNNFGGHDSICSACLMTVACVMDESEFAYRESKHVCDSIHLYWANQGRLSVLVADEEAAAHSLSAVQLSRPS